MYALYHEGATLQEVGDQFGFTKRRMSELFKQAGLETRPSGALTVDPEIVRKMYALYLKDATLRQVAEHFGVSPRRVARLFKQAKLKTRPPGRREEDYPVQEMYARYQQGATLPQVGSEFGVAATRVSELFTRASLETRPGGHHVKDYPVKDMYAFYLAGATLRQVGDDFGLSPNSVNRLFKQAGLKTRPPGRRMTEARF